MKDPSELTRDFDRAGFEFLVTEINSGLTFANLALGNESGSQTRERNKANARKAYEAVVELSEKVHLTREQERRLGTDSKS